MSRLFVVVTLFTMITGGGSELLQLDPTSSRPLLLSLPRSVDTTNIWIRTFLAGPFGGMRSPVRTEAGVWDYAIETVHEGRLATTLKVIVLAPGYQVQTLDLSSVIDSSERNIEVDMHALPPIPFYGRVRLPPTLDL